MTQQNHLKKVKICLTGQAGAAIICAPGQTVLGSWPLAEVSHQLPGWQSESPEARLLNALNGHFVQGSPLRAVTFRKWSIYFGIKTCFMSDLWVSCCIFNQLSNPRGTTCRLPHRDMILGRLAPDGLLVIHRDPASPEALQLAPPLKWNMYLYIYTYIYIFKYNDMCVIYLLHLTLCQDRCKHLRVIQTSLPSDKSVLFWSLAHAFRIHIYIYEYIYRERECVCV